MNGRADRWSAVGVLWLAVGCGDDGVVGPQAPGPDLAAERREACTALAEVWCASSALCEPITFASRYGDAVKCIARQTELCMGTRFGEGSNQTPATVRGCTDDTDRRALTDIDEHCLAWAREEADGDPCAETEIGELDDGEPCLVGSQCESGACVLTGACGYCRQAGEVGDPCYANGDCADDRVCADGHCTGLSDKGGECSDGEPCLPHLTCIAGTCEDRLTGTCEVVSDPVRDNPCKRWPLELACNFETCRPYELRGLGQACGFPVGGPTDEPIGQCAYGLACVGVNIVTQGTCEPAIADGNACSLAVAFETPLSYPFGSMCLAPAVCSEGRCTLPHTALCGAPHPP